MCIQVVEQYAVCHCVYHEHAIDQCSKANQRGHQVEKRFVPVGYACAEHSMQGQQQSSNTSTSRHPDSGYSSSGYYVNPHFRSKGY